MDMPHMRLRERGVRPDTWPAPATASSLDASSFHCRPLDPPGRCDPGRPPVAGGPRAIGQPNAAARAKDALPHEQDGAHAAPLPRPVRSGRDVAAGARVDRSPPALVGDGLEVGHGKARPLAREHYIPSLAAACADRLAAIAVDGTPSILASPARAERRRAEARGRAAIRNPQHGQKMPCHMIITAHVRHLFHGPYVPGATCTPVNGSFGGRPATYGTPLSAGIAVQAPLHVNGPWPPVPAVRARLVEGRRTCRGRKSAHPPPNGAEAGASESSPATRADTRVG